MLINENYKKLSPRDKWEECPRCGSGKVRKLGILNTLGGGMTNIGCGIWLLFIPIIGWIFGAIIIITGLVKLIISPFAGRLLECDDCDNSWMYGEYNKENKINKQNNETTKNNKKRGIIMNKLKKGLKYFGIAILSFIVLGLLMNDPDEQLQAQVKELELEVNHYEQIKDIEVEDVLKTVEQLEEKNTNLEVNNNELKEQVAEFEEEVTKLNQDNKSLLKKVDKLKNSNTESQSNTSQPNRKNFEESNISFNEGARGRNTVIGEITNNSGKNYDLAMFRISFYNNQEQLLGTERISMNNFRNGSTRSFDQLVRNIDINKVDRYRVEFDQGF